MSITVSPLQTDEYSKNYGKGRQDYIARGEALSPSSLTNGTVRSIYDTLIFNQIGVAGEVIFSWKFTEDALILAGTFEVHNGVSGSGHYQATLYDGNNNKANSLGAISALVETFSVHSIDSLYLERTIRVPKGTFVGLFMPFGLDIKEGVSIAYSLTYMSNL